MNLRYSPLLALAAAVIIVGIGSACSFRTTPIVASKSPVTSKSTGGRHVYAPSPSIVHYTVDFTLSRLEPIDRKNGVTLVRVDRDGAATIRVEPSGRTLTAKRGGYYRSDEFGTHGLQLVSSSYRSGTATFQRSGAMTEH